jgi:transient receptor potential cation channel subfamily A protein 1
VEYLLAEGTDIIHNKAGESFFDIAITDKNTAVALAALRNDRWREAMDLVSRHQGYPMLRLIEMMPDLAKVVLDKSVTTSQRHPNDQDFWINYDFTYLVCEKPESGQTGLKSKEPASREGPDSKNTATLLLADQQEATPLVALDKMVKFDRKDLLTHPLTSALLKSRWQSYGRLLFKLNTLVYVIFLVFLTIAVAARATETGTSNVNATSNQTQVEETTVICTEPCQQEMIAMGISI